MRHFRLLMLCLLICGVGLALYAGYANAQGDETPEYVGASECSSCHRGLARDHAESMHGLALQDAQSEEARILADFAAGEDLRTVQFPGEDAPRAFAQDDIAYVMGTGRYVQRFVVEAEPGQYYVLPAEWNTVEAQWQPLELAENWPDPGYNWLDNCAYCHTTGLDIQSSMWLDDGVMCEACHGPGSTHIALADEAGIRPNNDELASIRTAIVNSPDARTCGQCHSAGTSADGHPFPTDYRPGGELIGENYSISAPDDSAHWWPSGHASEVAMQYNEWFNSAHESALTSLQESEYADDSCLRCHSGDYRYIERVRGWFEEGYLDGVAPESLTVENAEFGVTCATCHNPHSEEDYDFLLVSEPDSLCAECHSDAGIEGHVHHPTQEFYEGIPLSEDLVGIPSAHYMAEEGPDCLSCHMARLPVSGAELATHSLKVVMPGAPEELESVAGCTTCHDSVTADQLATFVTDIQADTAARLEAAHAALAEDSPEWVAVALGMVEGEGSNGLHNYAYTNALLGAAEAELGLLIEEAPEETNDINGDGWIELPGIGVVENLTWPGLVGGVVLFFVLLIGGFVFIGRAGRQRLLGLILLLLAAAVIVVAVLVLQSDGKIDFVATGNDSYCMICHTGERDFTLVDGNTLPLGVIPDAIADSVHGDESEMGRMGCLDCHGEAIFPHSAPPVSLREYRAEMSDICLECHKGDRDHYNEYLGRNIAVGCADCHGAHGVQLASTLDELTHPLPAEGALEEPAADETEIPGPPPSGTLRPGMQGDN
jgi:predicted CXXCH cytochrome family protein